VMESPKSTSRGRMVADRSDRGSRPRGLFTRGALRFASRDAAVCGGRAGTGRWQWRLGSSS
jgi:hypothetical protein